MSQGNELYVICGSYGSGGTGVNGYATTIAGGKIAVPARCWKVVVVLPEGSSDASRVTTSTRIIAIDTPNTTSISPSWGTYRTTRGRHRGRYGLQHPLGRVEHRAKHHRVARRHRPYFLSGPRLLMPLHF